MKSEYHEHTSFHGTYMSYSIGFTSSIVLTLIPYFIVVNHMVPGNAVFIVVGLAIAQLVVQLVFFLHLSAHPKERWNLTAFIFTALMLWFIVVGSLWIMDHLNRNMTPMQIDAYMHKQN